MKQVLGLPAAGKKMTKEAMKKIRGGGGIDGGVPGVGYWHCGYACYETELQCKRVCNWTTCALTGPCSALVDE